MKRQLVLSILFIAFARTSFCQVKEIIDKDISLIRYVPYTRYLSNDVKKEKRINKRFRKKNHEYHEILSLDTLAIPYLIDKISDTIETPVRIPCSIHNLKQGDMAFALLNDIIPIPMHMVTGSQWDVMSCDSLPDGIWDYLYIDRKRFQKELKDFFVSYNGKIWMRIFKGKLSKKEGNELVKQLKFN